MLNKRISVNQTKIERLSCNSFRALKFDKADVKVITSGGFAAALNLLSAQFELSTDIKIETVFGSSFGGAHDSIPSRLAKGESADIIILSRSSLDDLTKLGEVIPTTRVNLVHSAIGMAVRNGEPKPDISSKEAFVKTLLEADSIGYSASVSGTYLTSIFRNLGIWKLIEHKSKRIFSERVGNVVARGEVQVGCQQISEILPISGINFVGPLPDEVQKVTTFSAGITARAQNKKMARILLNFLSCKEVTETIRSVGLYPATLE